MVCPGWSSSDAAGATADSDDSQEVRTGLGWLTVRAFALVEVGHRQAIDLFVRREDAYAALENTLGDEPDWTDLLSVGPIELDGRDLSAN